MRETSTIFPTNKSSECLFKKRKCVSFKHISKEINVISSKVYIARSARKKLIASAIYGTCNYLEYVTNKNHKAFLGYVQLNPFVCFFG